MNETILEVLIKNIIYKLVDAGFEDPTNEDITFKYGGKTIKLRLYTEWKWNEYLSTLTDARKLATKMGFGERPDQVVTYKNTNYYVRII